MRITTTRLLDRANAATERNQSLVGERAEQVSSGLRVARPSDDPAAWLAAHRAGLKRALSEGSGVAMQFARDRLDETDRALSTIFESVSSVHTLVTQGSSDSYSAASRKELAVQVRALFTVALGAANTRAPDGEYLLAGSASMAAPFDATGVYQGDGSARAVPTSEDALSVVTVAGTELTAANGVDVLPLFERVAAALDANDGPLLRDLLGDLQTSIEQVSLSRTRGGGAMAVLEDAAAAHSQLQQNLSEDISRYVEVDIVSAASELAKASSALDASSAVTSHVLAMLNRQASA